MKVKVYTLNSFAKTERGGNPAGVVLNADSLSKMEMQNISLKVGLSETAFVMKSKIADFKIKFFTTNSEVDLCGHATIGAFSLMMDKKIIKENTYTIETKIGVLNIECGNNMIFMDQSKPQFYQIIDAKEVARSLNINEKDIIEDIPIRVVSTGLKDIMIPVKSLKILYSINPDFHKISNISKNCNVIGYHVFTLETENLATASCRNFAPLYNIDEEAATGTSNGALSCYLYKYGIVSENYARKMIFEQGYSMKRPSEILTSLSIKNNKICRVKVGGTALDIKEKFVN
ncbi:PhzF family phenazine biosynthesis protein [Clostridium sp. LBM24168]